MVSLDRDYFIFIFFYRQYLAQGLAHSKCLANICRTNVFISQCQLCLNAFHSMFSLFSSSDVNLLQSQAAVLDMVIALLSAFTSSWDPGLGTEAKPQVT
jgi:hypothetical protein